jgi:hypothetical protein
VARILALLLTTAVAVAEESSVKAHIDALQRGGRRFVHQRLPSSRRQKELFPDAEEIPGGVGERLRKSEHGRAIFESGEASVTELIALLKDKERRTLAAVFLAEIGGDRAAAALLRGWRELRDKAKKKSVYVTAPPDGRIIGLGFRYEGIDAEFYGELILALCYAGRSASHGVAFDTKRALEESERLHNAGESLRREEKRDDEQLRWNVEPVETACEGLQLLAAAWGQDAPEMLARGLRSPVPAIRWTALQNASYADRDAEPVLRALGELLDDPEWRNDALEQVAFLIDREKLPDELSGNDRDELIARYKRKIIDRTAPDTATIKQLILAYARGKAERTGEFVVTRVLEDWQVIQQEKVSETDLLVLKLLTEALRANYRGAVNADREERFKTSSRGRAEARPARLDRLHQKPVGLAAARNRADRYDSAVRTTPAVPGRIPSDFATTRGSSSWLRTRIS